MKNKSYYYLTRHNTLLDTDKWSVNYSEEYQEVVIKEKNSKNEIQTKASALTDPVMGISIALAIAIHNIPEGITVSVPIYHATGNRKKAFLYSFGSGLANGHTLSARAF